MLLTCRRRWLSAFVVPFVAFGSLVLSASLASATQAGELIERTLAIVGGQVITLSDLKTATALHLVEPAGGTSDVRAVTTRLIDRLLMLREVQRYAPPEPAESEIERQLASIRARVGSAEQVMRVLEAGGFTEARLREWIRDDLRITAYLNQRFASERRADLIADWLSDLRRRTTIVELPRD